MIVVAGGDSFVYGSELKDCVGGAHSKNTFTALLAGEHYECVAWPGFGNDSIAREVIARCEQILSDELFVLVSWTFPGRYEFRFNYNTRQRKSPWYTITPWTVIADADAIEQEFITKNENILLDYTDNIQLAKETGVMEFADVFYRHVGNSEYWEVYSSLKEIVYLQNYLKTNNIPYLFTCADNSIWYNYTVDHADTVISSLHQQIDQDKWFWFPAGTNPQDTQNPRGFYQWALENKYDIGTTHPLEQAHLDASQLMQEKFNDLVKKSIQQN
jgi:hypothetical protein